MRRLLTTCALSTSLLVATAMPAFAHAGFLQASAPADSAETLTLRVPGERTGQRTMLVETKVPASFGFAACVAPPEFTCSADAKTDGSTIVVFKRTGGAADTAVLYSFDVQTPAKVGTYRFPTIQTYDGKDAEGNTEEFWTGDLSPSLNITASGTPVIPGSEPEEHESDADTAPEEKPAAKPAPSRNDEPDSSDDEVADDSDGADTPATTTKPTTTTSTTNTQTDAGNEDDDATTSEDGDEASEAPADAPTVTATETDLTADDDADDTAELAADEASSEDEGGAGLLLLVLGGVVVLGVGTGLTIRQKMQS